MTEISSGFKDTRRIIAQIGKETTWGSVVAASAKLMGVQALPTIVPLVKPKQLDEQLGSLSPNYRSSVVQTGGAWDVPSIATYEDILFWLAMNFGVQTPVVGPPDVWTFPGNLTTSPTPYIATIEVGDLVGNGTSLTGCTLQTLAITGTYSNEITLDAKGFGKTFSSAATLTPALTNRTVEQALFPQCAFAMDPASTAAGTTPFTNTIVHFTLNLTSGFNPVYTGGALAPTGFVYQKADADLTVGLLYNSTLATALNANLIAGKRAVLQIKSTSSTHVIEMDFAGVLADDPTYFGDDQGAQMVELKLNAQYDDTMTNYCKVIVSNGLAAMPV